MSAGEAVIVQQPTVQEVEAFLFHEAALLDAGKYSEWLQLFDADGDYWVPATAAQVSPLDEVSHIYEDRMLREIRVERFSSPYAPSLKPRPRSSHLVANVRLGEYRADYWTVYSRFVVAQFHRDTQTLLTGGYVHELRYSAGQFRIKRKRVDLVNCEGALGDIVIYL